MLNKMFLPETHQATLSYKEQTINFEIFDKCPICGKKISPKFKYACFSPFIDSLNPIELAKNSKVNALYECPDCHNGILIFYNPSFKTFFSDFQNEDVIDKWNKFNIESIFPTAIAQFPYNDIISKVSSRFKDIYVQSLQAKLDGKNELIGIGYRKSIEFLIKDYLLYINHEKSDKIPNLPLGECIKLIDSSKIQTLAKASTWLGNDETHYVRKHTDKDICDLEKFLDALVYYLTYELTVDEASSFINKS